MGWREAIILALPFLICLVFAIDQIFFDEHKTGLDDDDKRGVVKMPDERGAFATEKEVERCTRDLKSKWSNRVRLDREVLGAIELAFMRGYQSGFENALKVKKGRSRS